MKNSLKTARGRALWLLAAAVFAAVLTVPSALAFNPDTLVTVGSPVTPFSQNKQNEPAVAIDANHPNVLVAGANEEVDMEACNAGNDTTCPFTPGVGVSGVYFSFDSGTTWIQPTYTGWTARDCLGVPGPDPGCTPHVGPIGTLPWYYENGLVADGDPAVAFGPRPGLGGFSWANGSRLYYANLTSNFSAFRSEQAFKGFEALAVSRTDNPQAAAAGVKSAWMQPVIVSKQNAALFEDKEQIWADSAASSPFFGNVYVCSAAYRGAVGRGFTPVPILVAVSSDGGDTWKTHQITPGANNIQRGFSSGCTVRTDSRGVVYVFYTRFQFGFPGIGAHMLVQSFNGGHTWTRPRALFPVNDACYRVDEVNGRCVEDGVAGARNDLTAAPSVDIANGAPTGADATDGIIDAWADGNGGLNQEKVMVSYSRDHGRNFSAPAPISSPGDRGYYAAPAISPNGTDVYVVYNAFLTPFAETTFTPRALVGVVKHADVPVGGTPVGWTELHRGAAGDPRGSSQNNLIAEFLGDYVYAAATRTYGAAVWNDVRNAADCPAIDAWRMALQTGASASRPAPQQQCPPNFGNSDIFGGTYPDPTP
jgi:hypothetical protein